MIELPSLNIERELSRPVINLCLPPWALCPCSKVSHMQTHTHVHANTHYFIHLPTTLSLPGKVIQCTTCGAWKKMSKIVDLVLSWVHPLNVFLSCPETTSPIGGDISSLLGLSTKDRTGLVQLYEKEQKGYWTKQFGVSECFQSHFYPYACLKCFLEMDIVLWFYLWSSICLNLSFH